ncbi:hypothetical protein TNCV_299071 [Trichonephila clavipes]|nr:hypothetical protein TNCV_299071 [Trichonephila clavipes]
MVYGLSGTGSTAEVLPLKPFLEDEMRNHVSQSMDGISHIPNTPSRDLTLDDFNRMYELHLLSENHQTHSPR